MVSCKSCARITIQFSTSLTLFREGGCVCKFAHPYLDVAKAPQIFLVLISSYQIYSMKIWPMQHQVCIKISKCPLLFKTCPKCIFQWQKHVATVFSKLFPKFSDFSQFPKFSPKMALQGQLWPKFSDQETKLIPSDLLILLLLPCIYH